MKSLSVEGVQKFGSINTKLVKLQYECEENTPLNDKVLWSIEEQQIDKTHFMECIEKVEFFRLQNRNSVPIGCFSEICVLVLENCR